jgi:hypothetical protein
MLVGLGRVPKHLDEEVHIVIALARHLFAHDVQDL